MKKFNLFLIALTFVVFNLSATPKKVKNFDENPVKPNENLRTEIVSILGTDYPFTLENIETIEVLFTLNTNQEIIVISTNSKNKVFENYLKVKLNYKKVHYTINKQGKLYLLPLRIAK
ncbi:MAG: hypothetical protein ABFR32_01235 [Bacteroidota bacterium]